MIAVLEEAPTVQSFSKESLTSKRIVDGSIENFAVRPWGFIICLRIYRFCNIMQRDFSLKNSLHFLRYLYACKNLVLLDFSKYLRDYKEFPKS